MVSLCWGPCSRVVGLFLVLFGLVLCLCLLALIKRLFMLDVLFGGEPVLSVLLLLLSVLLLLLGGLGLC